MTIVLNGEARELPAGTTVHVGGCGAGLMVKVRLTGSAAL